MSLTFYIHHFRLIWHRRRRRHRTASWRDAMTFAALSKRACVSVSVCLIYININERLGARARARQAKIYIRKLAFGTNISSYVIH